MAIRAFRVARVRAEYPNQLDYSNLQSSFPKTNALSIRPQGLLLPCFAIRMFSMSAIRLNLQTVGVVIFKIPASC